MQLQENLPRRGRVAMIDLLNVFRIRDLDRLSQDYAIADVEGLNRDQADYFRSIDRLTALSRMVKRPVCFLYFRGAPVIVYPQGTLLPATIDLGNRLLTVRPREEVATIDFSKSSEFDELRLRVLRFAIEEKVRSTRAFWQPSTGQPFFNFEPQRAENGIGLYLGAKVRPTVLPDGSVGICVDPTSRLIAVDSLPKNLTREAFEDRWKGQRAIYRYGDSWYEIRCDMLAQQTVSRYPIRGQNAVTNLHRLLLDTIPKPVPKHIANLDADGAVIVYRNARGDERSAPAELCFAIQDTEDVRETRLGRGTIMEPQARFNMACRFIEDYVPNFVVGNVALSVERDPFRPATIELDIPDLQFGHGTVLSVKGTPGAHNVALSKLGETRLRLLQDRHAGPIDTASFDRQYLVLPQSAAASFGTAYAADLRAAVDALHPQGRYAPQSVTYDDAVRRTYADQARAIKSAISNLNPPGYAVVMVHRCKSGRRHEDALAAFVQRYLRQEADTTASVVHYDTAERLYEARASTPGATRYQLRADQKGKARGYFRNVAINKVLLLSQFWPFGLAQPLHGDLVIGIDIKNNSCCLLSVSGRGQRVRHDVKTSNQKEQLNAKQVYGYLYDLITQEAHATTEPIRKIVLHRDGRTFPSEITGARRAIEKLKAGAILPADAELSIVEVHKHNSVPMRLVSWDEKSNQLFKPCIGKAVVMTQDEGYVCTTGEPFSRPGTPRPLRIVRAYGAMPIEHCMQDIFSLTNLTWTRPEDCSRFPITIRLADKFLADEKTEYDEDELEFGLGEFSEEEQTA